MTNDNETTERDVDDDGTDEVEFATEIARHSQAAARLFDGFALATGQDRHVARLAMVMAIIAECETETDLEALQISIDNLIAARTDPEVMQAAALAALNTEAAQ